VLADTSLVLGTMPFDGTRDDIKTTRVYHSAPYCGVLLDTRLLGGLLGVGGER
jgi:hypothetical protein